MAGSCGFPASIFPVCSVLLPLPVIIPLIILPFINSKIYCASC